MLGVFDSGEGGENVAGELRELYPSLDLALFKDRKNAPFGRRAVGELIKITSDGIDRLLGLGCERVLIACCTASAVHGLLRYDQAARSVPIIRPTSSRAKELTHSGKIALLATDATVRSRAFVRELGDSLRIEIPASRLVDEIEHGAKDGNVSTGLGEYVRVLLDRVASSDADTLILGCTHFARLSGEIAEAYRRITKKEIIIVDSAREGARALKSLIGDPSGEGRIIRIE